MKLHKTILAKNSLDKSEQALKNAELSFNNDFFTEAHNKVYYSVFYLVLALGYLDEFVTGKHHQLMGWFNKKYIHELKLFDFKIVKIYNTLIRNRETFDYDVSQKPTKESVIKDIEDAKSFIDTVKPYVIKKLEAQAKEESNAN